jgi:nucleotide-binding universal stress UspA family protein
VVELAGAQACGPSAGRVVVGLDGTDGSDAALAYAIQAARRRGVGLTAVHVRASSDDPDRLRWIEERCRASFAAIAQPIAIGAGLGAVDAGLAAIDAELAAVDAGLAAMDARPAAVNTRRAAVDARLVVVDGNPARATGPAAALVAESSAAALIVLGSPSRGRLYRTSVARTVLRLAAGPVVLVRPGALGPRAGRR